MKMSVYRVKEVALWMLWSWVYMIEPNPLKTAHHLQRKQMVVHDMVQTHVMEQHGIKEK